MARILEYPTLKQIGPEQWELAETLEYRVGHKTSTEIIIVPKGFKTDLASIPRVFWPVLPPFGRYSPGAVLHDFLYVNQGDTPGKIYSRKRCDEIFDETMKVMEVPWWKRKIMYYAVRAAGGFAWRKHG